MNLRYTLIHAVFWAGYGIIWAFIAPLMEHYGFSGSAIGAVTAAASLFAVVISPILAQIIGGSEKLLERHGAVALTLLACALTALALFSNGSHIILAAVFLLLGAIQVAVPPFMNTMGLVAAQAGYGVIYGFSRGIGSVSYAVCTFLFGILIERFAPPILLPCYVVSTLISALTLATFRHPHEHAAPGAEKENGIGAFALMRAYPRFTVTLLACALFYGAHHIYNIYLNSILARVGANESAMGIALAISAAVELPAMTFVSKHEKSFPAAASSSLQPQLCWCALWCTPSPPAPSGSIWCSACSFLSTAFSSPRPSTTLTATCPRRRSCRASPSSSWRRTVSARRWAASLAAC